MAVSQSIQELSKPTISRFAQWLLPTALIEQALFWVLLACVSTLFTLGISALSPCSLTASLPFLAIVIVASSIRWKLKGYVASLVFLVAYAFFFFPQIPQEGFLWQLGVLSSLALDCSLAYICALEIENLFVQKEQEAQAKEIVLQQQTVEHEEAKEKWEEEKKSFEEEVQRWKDEAQQRRIEKRADEKRLGLLQTDLTFLSHQKESLIAEAHQARNLACERLQSLENNLEEMRILSSSVQSLTERNRALEEKLSSYEYQTLEQEELKSTLEQSQQKIQEFQLKLQEQLTQIQELRNQASENKEKLQQAHASLEEQAKSLMDAQNSRAAYEQEILSLKEEVAKKIENFEAKAEMEQQVLNLQKERAKMEGMYLQLRQQFEEKSQILSQARKELFQQESFLLALEKEKSLAASEPVTEPSQQQFTLLWKDLNTLDEEKASLEQEVKALEELVSRLLNL